MSTGFDGVYIRATVSTWLIQEPLTVDIGVPLVIYLVVPNKEAMSITQCRNADCSSGWDYGANDGLVEQTAVCHWNKYARKP